MRVKFCGLRRLEDVEAAAAAGAAYVGFVFFPPSPRHLSPDDARQLSTAAHAAGLTRVALTVDADDAALEEIARKTEVDMFQLHGSESPERVNAVRARFNLPVMKAIGVADAPDLERIDAYGAVADQILIDAKPPKNATLPGGNGLTFDWRLIAERSWSTPWMLAGGLTPANVADAVELTGATQVDVSSGVERGRGVKDPELMRAFVRAANGEAVAAAP